MSRRQKRSLGMALLGLLALGIGWAVTVGATERTSPREIVLEARRLAFYVPGNPRPNPILRVAPGETVRLVLVNRDRGMRHDLVLESLGAATPLLAGEGSSASLLLRVPVEEGEHEYLCSLHRQLMRGRMLVAASDR